jgi:HPt (histidine-containing phosphotransfer) domain-containing protein
LPAVREGRGGHPFAAEILLMNEHHTPVAERTTDLAPATELLRQEAAEHHRSLDPEAALAEAGGDRCLLAHLAALFLAACPKWTADLRAALVEGAPARLREAAHALKGALNVFAARAAADAAFRLERMGREGDLSGAAAVWATLEQELARLRPALEDLAQS